MLSHNEPNFDEDYDEVIKGRRLRGFVHSVLEQVAALSDKNPEWANPILEQWANDVETSRNERLEHERTRERHVHLLFSQSAAGSMKEDFRVQDCGLRVSCCLLMISFP